MIHHYAGVIHHSNDKMIVFKVHTTVTEDKKISSSRVGKATYAEKFGHPARLVINCRWLL